MTRPFTPDTVEHPAVNHSVVEVVRVSDDAAAWPEPAHRAANVGVARPCPPAPALTRTDSLAIASAVCGFTAIVPIVSQVAGLGFGLASLARIRRARREGVALRGRGWAWAGIVTSGVLLLSWVVAIGALFVVADYLARAGDLLPGLDGVGP